MLNCEREKNTAFFKNLFTSHTPHSAVHLLFLIANGEKARSFSLGLNMVLALPYPKKAVKY